jgi:hypothetical protein
MLLPRGAEPLIQVVGVEFGRNLTGWLVSDVQRFAIRRRCHGRGGMFDPSRRGAAGAHFDAAQVLVAGQRGDQNRVFGEVHQLMEGEFTKHPRPIGWSRMPLSLRQARFRRSRPGNTQTSSTQWSLSHSRSG